jgi:hypothetical protein
MVFTGNLVKKVAVREGEGRNGHWKMASYLLETVESFPKRMMVDVSDGEMGRIAQWDAFMGKNVKVQFDIDAREYNGRWFNSIRAWGIKDANEKEEEKETALESAGTAAGEAARGAVAGADAPAAVAEGEKKGEGEGKQLYWGDKAEKNEDLPF